MEGNPMQPPSLHRYLYAYANPTVYTDRTGRQVNDDDMEKVAIALGWNDKQYRGAVSVQAAAHEQTAGTAYGAGKLTAEGLWEVTKYGAKLLSKTLFNVGDAKDVVDPAIHVVNATADALRAGPVGFVEYEASKSMQADALRRMGQNFAAGELYGPEGAALLGATTSVSRLGGTFSVAKIGAADASVVVEGANGEVALKRMTLAASNDDALIGPTIGKSGFKSWNEFNAEAYRRYQQYVDDAYDSATNAEAQGLLRGNPNTRIGDAVDRFSRIRLRDWLQAEGVSEGPGNPVQLNRWLRDPSGSGEYVRPDVQLPGTIMDATVGKKPPGTPQLSKNAEYSGGTPTTIVRPSKLGGSCIILPCPED